MGRKFTAYVCNRKYDDESIRLHKVFIIERRLTWMVAPESREHFNYRSTFQKSGKHTHFFLTPEEAIAYRIKCVKRSIVESKKYIAQGKADLKFLQALAKKGKKKHG
jgi:hypothetical protein